MYLKVIFRFFSWSCIFSCIKAYSKWLNFSIVGAYLLQLWLPIRLTLVELLVLAGLFCFEDWAHQERKKYELAVGKESNETGLLQNIKRKQIYYYCLSYIYWFLIFAIPNLFFRDFLKRKYSLLESALIAAGLVLYDFLKKKRHKGNVEN